MGSGIGGVGQRSWLVTFRSGSARDMKVQALDKCPRIGVGVGGYLGMKEQRRGDRVTGANI